MTLHIHQIKQLCLRSSNRNSEMADVEPVGHFCDAAYFPIKYALALSQIVAAAIGAALQAEIRSKSLRLFPLFAVARA